MIIWGSKVREKELSAGEFHCPNCRGQRQYKLIRMGRYFTLYFVPLFEREKLGEYVKCGACQKLYKPEVLNYVPPLPSQLALASVSSDLEAGTPLQMAYRKLVNTGVDDAAAQQAITSYTGGRANQCPKCSYAYAPGVRFCANCGARELNTNVPMPPLTQTGPQSA